LICDTGPGVRCVGSARAKHLVCRDFVVVVTALSVSRRSLGAAQHEFPACSHLLGPLPRPQLPLDALRIHALEPLSA